MPVTVVLAFLTALSVAACTGGGLLLGIGLVTTKFLWLKAAGVGFIALGCGWNGILYSRLLRWLGEHHA